MKISRTIVVLDAADVHAASSTRFSSLLDRTAIALTQIHKPLRPRCMIDPWSGAAVRRADVRRSRRAQDSRAGSGPCRAKSY